MAQGDYHSIEQGDKDKQFYEIEDDVLVEVVKLAAEDVEAAPAPAAAATLSNVNDNNASTTLLAANANRVGAILVNDSTATLMLKYGATASATSFTYKVAPGGTWEMPAPVYTGIIDGIWDANASGAARITELT